MDRELCSLILKISLQTYCVARLLLKKSRIAAKGRYRRILPKVQQEIRGSLQQIMPVTMAQCSTTARTITFVMCHESKGKKSGLLGKICPYI